jgi:hypothetical protein
MIIKWSINATLFFANKMKKIVAYQIDTELFFEELSAKKNEQNGLLCIYIWYYLKRG